LYAALPERWLRWVFTLLGKPAGESPPFDIVEWVDGELSWFVLGQVFLLGISTVACLYSRPVAVKVAVALLGVAATAWAIYVGDFAFTTRADLALSERFSFSL
jgi:hypothetical protein